MVSKLYQHKPMAREEEQTGGIVDTDVSHPPTDAEVREDRSPDLSLDSMFAASDDFGASQFDSFDDDPSTSATARAPFPIRLSPGQRIGAFELLEPIGHGGMGVVFKARDHRLNRVVAIKILLSHLFDTKSLKRFMSEARAAGALDHPNIVPVYDVGESDGCHYIVMAYVDGESLAERLARIASPLPPRAAARFVEEIGMAAAHSHANAIVHRDLKPANILVDAKDRVRVTDFGLARELNSKEDLTRTGQVMGTPGFMSPEAASGQSRSIEAAADIYGMGAVLYCLLVNRPPFQAATPLETIRQVTSREVVPLRQLDTSIPKDLETICLKALEKDAARRYPSAQEMVDDLRRFQSGVPIKARPISLIGKAMRWVKRNKAAAAMTVLATLLCIASLFAVLLWGQSHDSRQAAAAAATNAQLAEELAQTQEYYSLINEAKRHIAEGAPGWSWRALEKTKQAAAISSPVRDELDLRNTSAECLRALDFRSVATLVDDMHVADVTFSPDGRRLAVAEMKRQDSMRVRIYDTETWKLWRKFNVPILGENLKRLFSGTPKFQEGIRHLAFSPDGKWLVAGTRHGKIFAVNLDDPNSDPRKVAMWQAHDAQVKQLEFSADGKTLYSLDDVPSLKRWRVGDWGELEEKPWLPTDANRIAIDPRGKFVAVDDGEIFDAQSGTMLDRPAERLQSLCFSPDGRFLCGKIYEKPTVLIHDLATWQSRDWYSDPEMNVYPHQPLFIDGTSTWFLSNGYDERVALFDFVSREMIGEILTPGRDSAPTAADPAGRFFAVGLALGVEVYEVRSRDISFGLDSQVDPIQALDTSPNSDDCVILAEADTNSTGSVIAKYRIPDRAAVSRQHFSAAVGSVFERPRTPRSLSMSDSSSTVLFTSAGMPPLVWNPDPKMPAPSGFNEDKEDSFTAIHGEALADLVHEIDAGKSSAMVDGSLRFGNFAPGGSFRLDLPRAANQGDGRYLYLNVRSGQSLPTAVWQVSLMNSEGDAVPVAEIAGLSTSLHLVPLGFVPHGYGQLKVQVTADSANQDLFLHELILVRVRAHRPHSMQLEDSGPVAVDGTRQLFWSVLDEDQLFAWRGPEREVVFHWNNRPALNLQGVSRINAIATGGDWTVAGTRFGQLAIISNEALKIERIVNGPGGPATACALSADDVGVLGTQDGQVRIFDLSDGTTVQDLPPFTHEIAAVDVSASGEWIVVAVKEKGLHLFRRAGQEFQLYVRQSDDVASARLAGNDRYLVVLMSGDRAPRIWRLDRLREHWTAWNID